MQKLQEVPAQEHSIFDSFGIKGVQYSFSQTAKYRVDKPTVIDAC